MKGSFYIKRNTLTVVVRVCSERLLPTADPAFEQRLPLVLATDATDGEICADGTTTDSLKRLVIRLDRFRPRHVMIASDEEHHVHHRPPWYEKLRLKTECFQAYLKISTI